jgi:endonuclease/exonuclease/phosphatase family metal-dependent hydrolase
MIKIVTYNILHGYHSDLIIKKIELLIEKGADVICLQEADLPFKHLLNDLFRKADWQVEYFHNTIACNLAIAWNPKRLRLKDIKQINLPYPNKPSLGRKILRMRKPLIRGALAANFMVENQLLRVTNTHLSWEGGFAHRFRQLGYLANILQQQPVEREVLVGDFNTFAPAVMRRFQEKKIEQILNQGWLNVFPDHPWTCDISYNAPQDGYDTFARIARFLGVKIRSRLDYVFTRNLGVVSTEMLDLPGSDHRPLLAKFRF